MLLQDVAQTFLDDLSVGSGARHDDVASDGGMEGPVMEGGMERGMGSSGELPPLEDAGDDPVGRHTHPDTALQPPLGAGEVS